MSSIGCSGVHALIRLICLAGAAWLFETGLHAEPYCSLHVFVDNRRPAESFSILVEEPNGLSAKASTKGGLVKFCNLGLGPIVVTVGDPGCSQVVVRNVQLFWKVTIPLRIIYEDAGCYAGAPGVGCSFLYRFVDSRHGPIPSVSLVSDEFSIALGTSMVELWSIYLIVRTLS